MHVEIIGMILYDTFFLLVTFNKKKKKLCNESNVKLTKLR